jgi:hypothetical protein
VAGVSFDWIRPIARQLTAKCRTDQWVIKRAYEVLESIWFMWNSILGKVQENIRVSCALGA